MTYCSLLSSDWLRWMRWLRASERCLLVTYKASPGWTMRPGRLQRKRWVSFGLLAQRYDCKRSLSFCSIWFMCGYVWHISTVTLSHVFSNKTWNFIKSCAAFEATKIWNKRSISNILETNRLYIWQICTVFSLVGSSYSRENRVLGKHHERYIFGPGIQRCEQWYTIINLRYLLLDQPYSLIFLLSWKLKVKFMLRDSTLIALSGITLCWT